MRHIVRLILVLLLVSLAGSVALMAEDNTLGWPEIAPELWPDNRGAFIQDLALKVLTERGPIEPPPVVPPGKEFQPLGQNPSRLINGDFAHSGVVSTPGNLDSSSAQAIPGSRTQSFLSEHRVTERSLRGTIKRLG